MSWACNQETIGRQKVGEKPLKERLRELGSSFPVLEKGGQGMLAEFWEDHLPQPPTLFPSVALQPCQYTPRESSGRV